MQMEVGADPSEVGRARRWARSRLAGSGIGLDEPLAETLILLISELVTNAVVHTGCPAVLRMLFPGTGAAAGVMAAGAAGTVRVEVADISARPPSGGAPRVTTREAGAWSWWTVSPTAGAGTVRVWASGSGARSIAVTRSGLVLLSHNTPRQIGRSRQKSRPGVDVKCSRDHPWMQRFVARGRREVRVPRAALASAGRGPARSQG
ncbi:hypothetical protein GCM10020000_46250 [Streptomyces olivoverticillatus]